MSDYRCEEYDADNHPNCISLGLPQCLKCAEGRFAQREKPSVSIREQEAISLLYIMYRHFHEGGYGGVLSHATTDEEMLEMVHSWMGNNGCDPYTSDGPTQIAEFAEASSAAAKTAWWQIRFCEIGMQARIQR